MKHSLHLSQTQKLIMTPRLQQALKLLQVPTLELQQILKQEVLQNPLLEEVDEVTEQEDLEREESADEQNNEEADDPAEEDPIDAVVRERPTRILLTNEIELVRCTCSTRAQQRDNTDDRTHMVSPDSAAHVYHGLSFGRGANSASHILSALRTRSTCHGCSRRPVMRCQLSISANVIRAAPHPVEPRLSATPPHEAFRSARPMDSARPPDRSRTGSAPPYRLSAAICPSTDYNKHNGIELA